MKFPKFSWYEDQENQESEPKLDPERFMAEVLLDAKEATKEGIPASGLILYANETKWVTKKSIKGTQEGKVELANNGKQLVYFVKATEDQTPDNDSATNEILNNNDLIIGFAPTLTNAWRKELTNNSVQPNSIQEVINKRNLAYKYIENKQMPLNPDEWVLNEPSFEVFIICKIGDKYFEYTKYPGAKYDENGEIKHIYTRKAEETYLGDDGFLFLGATLPLKPFEADSLEAFSHRDLRVFFMTKAVKDEKPMTASNKQAITSLRPALNPI